MRRKIDHTPTRHLPSTIAGIVAITVILVTSGCDGTGDEILVSDYAGWEVTTARVLNNTIPGHGAGLRKIFINASGVDTPLGSDGSVTYPDGTVIVKEVFASKEPASGDAPVMLTIMVKASDADEALGDWIWLVKDPESGAETIMQEEFCITCHANANEAHPYADGNGAEVFRDYVFFPYGIDELAAP